MGRPDRLEVLLLPHLPLDEPLEIGSWLVGPVFEHPWASADVRAATEKLLERHEALAEPPSVVAELDGRPRTRLERDEHELRALQRALTFAGLDGNPDVREQGWAAYRAVSADNLTMEGWTLDIEEGWFSTRRGKLIEERVGGLRLDDAASRVPVPLEIRHPEPVHLDSELANAVLDYLTGSAGPACKGGRRVGAAIDWLTLAWRNTASVGFAPRVVFLRTALETLFPGKSRQIATALREHFERFANEASVALDRTLDDLLWSPTDVPRHMAHDGSGALLTDMQDWFWTFNAARNRIVHEGETEVVEYEGPAASFHGDLFWTAERLLREIVRTELAITGYGDVWMKPDSRRLHRAAVSAIEELGQPAANEAGDD